MTEWAEPVSVYSLIKSKLNSYYIFSMSRSIASIFMFGNSTRLVSLVGYLVALAAAVLCAARADTFGGGADAFTIDFRSVGNPGNNADTRVEANPVGSSSAGLILNAGSVDYEYRIGTYEVSRDMITKANNVGNLEITLVDLSKYNGSENGVNRPATGISWNEAARFVNWLNVSEGYGPAYKFALQPGDLGYSANADLILWEIGDAGYDATNRYRNSKAKYFLPSTNEWYKAAFYNPASSSYYNYATSSNAAPIPVAGGTDVGTAVYDFQSGPADITNAGGLSPYGTMGQGGNAFEWIESAYSWNPDTDSLRYIRGGSWTFFGIPDFHLQSARSTFFPPSTEFLDVGFRLVSIPEPRVVVLVLIGIVGCIVFRNTKSK